MMEVCILLGSWSRVNPDIRKSDLETRVEFNNVVHLPTETLTSFS
jgi:hypothetical protein